MSQITTFAEFHASIHTAFEDVFYFRASAADLPAVLLQVQGNVSESFRDSHSVLFDGASNPFRVARKFVPDMSFIEDKFLSGLSDEVLGCEPVEFVVEGEDLVRLITRDDVVDFLLLGGLPFLVRLVETLVKEGLLK